VDEEWEVRKDVIQRAAEEIIGKEIPINRNPWYDLSVETNSREK
jgi:hypothetical protein